MQTAQLSRQQIMHTCRMYGRHQSLLRVDKFFQYLSNQQNNKTVATKSVLNLRRKEKKGVEDSLVIKDKPGKSSTSPAVCHGGSEKARP